MGEAIGGGGGPTRDGTGHGHPEMRGVHVPGLSDLGPEAPKVPMKVASPTYPSARSDFSARSEIAGGSAAGARAWRAARRWILDGKTLRSRCDRIKWNAHYRHARGPLVGARR